MTTPFDPGKPSADGSPTEPVPPLQPVPTFAPAPVEPTALPAAAVNAGPTLVPAPVKPARRSGGVSILNVALGVAVLVATAGVAFAVGRTTAPTTAAAQVTANGGNGGRFFTNGNGPNASFAPGAGG